MPPIAGSITSIFKQPMEGIEYISDSSDEDNDDWSPYLRRSDACPGVPFLASDDEDTKEYAADSGGYAMLENFSRRISAAWTLVEELTYHPKKGKYTNNTMVSKKMDAELKKRGGGEYKINISLIQDPNTDLLW
jgi:hypothetical protein